MLRQLLCLHLPKQDIPTAPVAESPDTTIGIFTKPIAPDAETPVNVTVMGMAAWTVPNAVVAASPVKVTVTPVPSETVTLSSVEDNCGDVTFTEASASALTVPSVIAMGSLVTGCSDSPATATFLTEPVALTPVTPTVASGLRPNQSK